MQRDTCYFCQKQGHWSVNCPVKQQQQQQQPMMMMNKTKKATSTESSSTSSSSGGLPITNPYKQCPCGIGCCIVRTSTTDKNPGRLFYKCPGKPACHFFQWCDDNNSDEKRITVPVPLFPMCSCGAGVCTRLKVTKEGPNKGKLFFVCPVSKGQGACNFFQWEDAPMKNTSNGYLDGNNYSPRSTLAHTHTHTRPTNGFNGKPYGNELKETLSPRGPELPLNGGEYHVEEKEIVKSDSILISPMRNISLREDNNTSSPPAGQCYRCGKAGHWMKDCSVVAISSSPCFKCGKIGHWMKDCTTTY